MFFSKNNNTEVLNLLDQIEAFIKNDINSIEVSDKQIDGEVYNKVKNISQLLQDKQKEDITVYGEIMLSAEKLSDGITTDRIQNKSSNEKLNYIAKTLNMMNSKLDKALGDVCGVLDEYSKHNFMNKIDDDLFRDGKLKDLLSGINFLNEQITQNLLVTYRTSLVMEKESSNLLDKSSKLSNDSNSHPDHFTGASRVRASLTVSKPMARRR